VHLEAVVGGERGERGVQVGVVQDRVWDLRERRQARVRGRGRWSDDERASRAEETHSSVEGARVGGGGVPKREAHRQRRGSAAVTYLVPHETLWGVRGFRFLLHRRRGVGGGGHGSVRGQE